MAIDCVDDIEPINQCVAGIGQLIFDFDFPVTAGADVVVYIDNACQLCGGDYTVQGAGGAGGGTITFSAAPGIGKFVTIYRDIPIARPVDSQQHASWKAADVNAELNRTTMMMQQLERNIERSLRWPLMENVASDSLLLAPLANWQGKYLFINAQGRPEPAGAVTGSPLSQSVIAQYLSPQTQAEAAAGIVPSSYVYAELDVRRYGASPSSADNTAAFNAAIAVANKAHRCIVIVEAGEYVFTTKDPLTPMTVSGCLGIIGPSDGAAVLVFNHSNDCIRARGTYKRFENIHIQNADVTPRKTRTAVLRISNCAYGYFANLYIAGGAHNQCNFLLEMDYDGSAQDAYLLCHVGCWYNTLINVTAGYLATGANVGFGIVFWTTPRAINVVNPTNERKGTYTGSVSHNVIQTINSESFVHGLYFDTYCNNNVVQGGQLLGSLDGIRMVDSSHNRVIGLALNQVVNNPIHETGSSSRNYYDVALMRPGVKMPWSFGVLTETAEVRHRGDGTVIPQRFLAPIEVPNGDGASMLGGANLMHAGIKGSSCFKVSRDGDVLLSDKTSKVGFFGSDGAKKPTVSGSRDGNAALESLLKALESLGLINDRTRP